MAQAGIGVIQSIFQLFWQFRAILVNWHRDCSRWVERDGREDVAGGQV